MSQAVNWFSIQGPSGPALHKFYGSVFGWNMRSMPGPGQMQMVPAAKGSIPGGIGASMDGQASVAVYVGVKDIDATFSKIQRAGGRVAMPKQELPGGMGTVAGLLDPAGNWIGLWMAAKKAPKKAAKKAGAKKAGARKAAAPKRATGAKKKAGGAAPKKRAAKKTGRR